MSLSIPARILALKGQKINKIEFNSESKKVLIQCQRDKRKLAIDPLTGRRGRINRLVRRQVRDTPILGHPCWIEIELAQVFLSKNERRMEQCSFVDTGCYFTHRFCRLVSGLCRHLSIDGVSRDLGLRWENTKNIDKAYLHETLPALEPDKLTGLKMIGVDEVARAKRT